ncbi:MAG: glycosyltransferase family 2 protein [Solirubrobacteraceae bacterium]
MRAAVCVASHRRPVRLRWLLDALTEQTIEDFEVVVCHDDGPGSETATLLADHPLGERLRVVEPAGRSDPGHQRNRAWRAAGAPLIVFTDDDCRPPAAWLERLLAAADAHPGAVVQGSVAPDPDEAHLLALAPHARTLQVDPPAPYAQCANIAYPRELLERIGGFDEREPPLQGGEDTDLCRRAIEAGAAYVGAADALTWHAVEPGSLPSRLRSIARWQHLAFVVARHPQMREHLFARVFWRPSHAALPFALYGLARRRPLLALPWALLARPRYGNSPRGLARAASELPGRLVVETTELGTAVRGSARYRTLFL